MAAGKRLCKFPIPDGFVWSHNDDCYKHPDGRTWDSEANVIHDATGKVTAILPVGETVEQEIQRKGLTAPRVTPTDIENSIVKEEFQVFANSTLTVCVLTLRNGFTVTGESACASPENFDAELGRRIARDKAKEKIWPLLGYALREHLYAPAS